MAVVEQPQQKMLSLNSASASILQIHKLISRQILYYVNLAERLLASSERLRHYRSNMHTTKDLKIDQESPKVHPVFIVRGCPSMEAS
jgi:hypothetical protein